MSWLSLRIPPAKKAWKSFTSKLQTRLHKLHKSKVIKKPKSRVCHVANTASSAKLAAILINPSPFLDQRPKKIPQPSNKGLRFRQSRRYFFKKKAAGPRAMYIDKLFKEPAATELVASRGKITKVPDQEAGAPGTGSSVNVKATAIGTVSTSAADDMWESLALASPQTVLIRELRISSRASEQKWRFRRLGHVAYSSICCAFCMRLLLLLVNRKKEGNFSLFVQYVWAKIALTSLCIHQWAD